MAIQYVKIVKTLVSSCDSCPAFEAEDGGIGGGYYWCEELQKQVSGKGIDKRCPMKRVKEPANV